MGWPNYVQEIIIGAIIVVAVAADRWRHAQGGERREELIRFGGPGERETRGSCSPTTPASTRPGSAKTGTRGSSVGRFVAD